VYIFYYCINYSIIKNKKISSDTLLPGVARGAPPLSFPCSIRSLCSPRNGIPNRGSGTTGRCPDSVRVVVPLPHRLIKGRAPNLDGPSHHGTIREGDKTRCLPAYGHGAASFNSGRPASTKMRATGSRESAALPGIVPAEAVVRPPPTAREYATSRRLLAAKHRRRISPTTSSRHRPHSRSARR